MTTSFNAEWAVIARESRGYSQSELSRLTGIPQARLSRFENERTEPSPEEIDQIASTLGYSARLFARTDIVRGPGVAEFLHRKLASAKVKDTKRIHGRCAVAEAQASELLKSAEVAGLYEIPKFSLDEFDGDIEKAALFARAKWDLPHGPIKNLVHVIERAGAIIVEMDFGVKDVDALHRHRPAGPPMFFLNKDKPADRIRFSLAHELAHAVLHEDFENLAEAEREADAFAAALLAPADQIRPHLPPTLSLRHLPALKKEWGMSMQALIRRAYDLGIIGEDRKRRLFMEINQRGWRRREPVELPAERPATWSMLLEKHIELSYTPEEVASVMYIRDEELAPMLRPNVAGRIGLVPPSSLPGAN